MTELTTPGAVRRAVKAKVKELLVNKTPAGASVFVNSSLPSDEESLPAIRIYTAGEEISRFNEAPKSYQRNLSLVIEVALVGDDDDDLDQKREDFADIIEGLVETDETLGGIVDRLEVSANEFAQDSQGESPYGKLSVLFTVRYYLDAVLETDVNDLETVNLNWRVKRPEETPTTVDAQDTIEFAN